MDAGTGFEGDVRHAFDNQVAYCEVNGAPITARVVRAIRGLLDETGEGGPFLQRVREWSGVPLADALPLRTAGGFHALHLLGAAPELAAIYAGERCDDLAIVREVVRRHGHALLPWLDSPPQTNEAGRSSGFATAMLWLAEQGLPTRFEPFEIGSSAGINLMMDRFQWNLGGVRVGADNPVLALSPQWRGPSPPVHTLRFDTLVGCDVAPLDLTDPEQALRLRAYIWPEHAVRFTRLDAAIAAAKVRAPCLVKMRAADFVEERLAQPQAEGTTRVLMHSIVWQYLPEDEKRRITAAMEQAGGQATPTRALAWVALEADRIVMGHSLQVRYWPGNGEPHRVAAAHAHGAWVEWLAGA